MSSGSSSQSVSGGVISKTPSSDLVDGAETRMRRRGGGGGGRTLYDNDEFCNGNALMHGGEEIASEHTPPRRSLLLVGRHGPNDDRVAGNDDKMAGP